MYIGIPNPNILMPLEKMAIHNLDTKKVIYVLYNPQSYQQTRSASYAPIPMMGMDVPVAQFVCGSGEILKVQLFFDSLSASSEVGGTLLDRAKFLGNSLLPSAANLIDIRTYTGKIYNLMRVEPKLHTPPELRLEWASLQFTGYLISCTQNFTRFDESGQPVRATLDCVFQEHVDMGKLASFGPLESPDTTKYRVVSQGDSLWSMSAKEYGEAKQWREIARANGIANPRTLRSGETLVLPALE